MITVDWEKGAGGPSYPQSVANTELVGRQTGLLLIDMLGLGLRPSDIHIVGFSLGAHIAACASHLIQSRLLVKIGRITGKSQNTGIMGYAHPTFTVKSYIM